MSYREHLGPVICEELSKRLPSYTGWLNLSWHQLPDGTSILIGTEFIYATGSDKPAPCPIDMGGDCPLILWK